MTELTLSFVDIAIVSMMVFFCGLLSIRLSLGFHKDLGIAATRMVVQLLMVGFALQMLLREGFGWLTIPAVLVMIAAATREIAARQKHKLVGKWRYLLPLTAVASASIPMTIMALFIVVGTVNPFDARHVIPLLGIILGSTMTTASIALNHFLGGVTRDVAGIEARLALGQTGRMALAQHGQEAIRAGLIPVLNQMAGAGLVTLPGIMSGQVLAGANPFSAALYQIILLVFLATSGTMGAVIAVRMMIGKLLDGRERLRLDRLR